MSSATVTGATLRLPAADLGVSAGEGVRRRARQWAGVCCWLLMLMTFSPPHRNASFLAGSLDVVGRSKVAIRFAVLGLLVFLLIRQWSSPRRKAALRLLCPWFLFIGWGLCSVFWSPLKNISLGQAGSFLILLLLTLNVALFAHAAEIEQFLKQLVLALIFLCTGLLICYFAFPELGSLTRSATGLLHATNGGATGSIGCVLLVATRFLYGWRWSRYVFVPGLAICGAVLLLAQSRTAVGITCLVTLGLAAYLATPLWRALALCIAGVGGAIYIAADLGWRITDTLTDILATYSARGQTTAQLAKLSGREEMWTAMWNSFLMSPWIGHGYFVSSDTGIMYVWYVWTNWTAHNFWLQILVSTGAVGGMLMAWALLNVVARLVRAWFTQSMDRRLTILVLSVLAWHVGWGINNESFAGPVQPESVVILVMIGIAVGQFAETQVGQRRSGQSLRPPYAAVPRAAL